MAKNQKHTVEEILIVHLHKLRGQIRAGIRKESAFASVTNAQHTLEKLSIVVNGRSMPFLNAALLDVTPRHVEDLVCQMQKLVSIKTTKNYFGTMRTLWRSAVLEGWLTHSLLESIKLGDLLGDLVKFKKKNLAKKIGKKTIAALIAHGGTGGKYRCHLLVAAKTGMRSGELRALRWRHVDFAGQFVHVEDNVDGFVCSSVTGYAIMDVKSAAGARSIPLPNDVLMALKAHRLASKYSSEDDFVFANTKGNPLGRSRLVPAALVPACKAIGAEQITWHDLRHFYASVLLEGMQDDLHTVARWMGHASIDTTKRVYGHWLSDPEKDRRQVEAANNLDFG